MALRELDLARERRCLRRARGTLASSRSRRTPDRDDDGSASSSSKRARTQSSQVARCGCKADRRDDARMCAARQIDLSASSGESPKQTMRSDTRPRGLRDRRSGPHSRPCRWAWVSITPAARRLRGTATRPERSTVCAAAASACARSRGRRRHRRPRPASADLLGHVRPEQHGEERTPSQSVASLSSSAAAAAGPPRSSELPGRRGLDVAVSARTSPDALERAVSRGARSGPRSSRNLGARAGARVAGTAGGRRLGSARPIAALRETRLRVVGESAVRTVLHAGVADAPSCPKPTSRRR